MSPEVLALLTFALFLFSPFAPGFKSSEIHRLCDLIRINDDRAVWTGPSFGIGSLRSQRVFVISFGVTNPNCQQVRRKILPCDNIYLFFLMKLECFENNTGRILIMSCSLPVIFFYYY